MIKVVCSLFENSKPGRERAGASAKRGLTSHRQAVAAAAAAAIAAAADVAAAAAVALFTF